MRKESEGALIIAVVAVLVFSGVVWYGFPDDSVQMSPSSIQKASTGILSKILVGGRDNEPPVAVSQSDIVVGAGYEFTLDGSASYDVDGQVVEYWWEFDYPISGWVAYPTFEWSFDEPGEKLGRLYVKDDDGAVSEPDEFTVTILDREGFGKHDDHLDAGCTDSDGDDIFTKGYVIDEDAFPCSTPGCRKWDSCAGPSSVREGICDYSGGKFETRDCPGGENCFNGACAEDDPCEGNELPVAHFTYTQQDLESFVIDLDASGSYDRDGDYLELHWDFDYDGVADLITEEKFVQHDFGGPGQYPVNLTVYDICEDSHEYLMYVYVEGVPVPVVADFDVYVLEGTDLWTGEQEWRLVDYENDVIELNRSVKIDGSGSTGPTHYYFYSYSDGGYNLDVFNPVDFKQLSEEGEFNVTLTVRDEAWSQVDVISKIVQVGGELEIRDTLDYPDPPEGVGCDKAAVRGNDFWCAGQEEADWSFAYANVDNPYDLGSFTYLTIVENIDVADMDINDEGLFVCEVVDGIEIYNATPSDFYLVKHMDLSYFDGSFPKQVEVIGDYLYVTTVFTGDAFLFTYDVSDLSTPARLDKLEIPSDPNGMTKVQDNVLVTVEKLFGGGKVMVIDIRDRDQPEVVEVFDSVTSYFVKSYENRVGYTSSSGTRFFELDIPENPSQEITRSPVWVVQGLGGSRFTFDKRTFYMGTMETIVKSDYSDPNEPYFMQDVHKQSQGNMPVFLRDPYGEEPYVLSGISARMLRSFSEYDP